MSPKAVAWTLLAAIACATVVLFNYWASYQPLSTLVYAGIVLVLCGLANIVIPFRFLGIRKRSAGALVLLGGVALTVAALFWPASTTRVARAGMRLDEVMPEYQFSETHSTRIHARPSHVLQAVRQATFGDLKSLVTLLKVRAAVLRAPFDNLAELQNKPVLDAFVESGYLISADEHEIVVFGAANARLKKRPNLRTVQDFVNYREQGGVKMAFAFRVDDAGNGWSRITTRTRVAALDDDTRKGLGRYWRVIVPGSGLLRLQWLDGIRRRAEGMPDTTV